MTHPIGKQTWVIAEGYIPKTSTGPEPDFLSHETACILNSGDKEAKIRVTIFFSDAEPLGPFELVVPPQRTKHFRFNDFKIPGVIPKGKDYASLFESNVPIVIQHTRLDSRQSANAIMTTIAYAVD